MTFTKKDDSTIQESQAILSNLSPGQVGLTEKWQFEKWLEKRQRARTDLFWLVNFILEHDWVTHEIHDPLIDFLPKFQGGEDNFDFDKHIWYGYTPKVPLEELSPEELRNLMVLQFRGSLKTTIVAEALSIQFILNYPDIRIALATCVGEQGETCMDPIRKHFQFNENLRFLFPELCPQAKKAADWGNMKEFTVCRRTRRRKEPTMMLISVGKVIAGYHCDVLLISDIVDINNVQTPGQIQNVINFVGHCEPLVERYPNGTGGWKIVEGTTYDYSDFYSVLRDSEAEKKADKHEWKIYVQSAKKDDGTAYWPERMPLARLEAMENDPTIGPRLVSAQYYLNPIPMGGGLAKDEEIIFIDDLKLLRALRPMLRKHVTIDLNGMDPASKKSDFFALNVSGFDRDGRMICLDLRCGRPSVFEVIDMMFEVDDLYGSPTMPLDYKMEKDMAEKVLMPFLKREMEKRHHYLTIVATSRDTRMSKKQRIRALQPWFQAKLIRFAGDITCKAELISQIKRFSDTSTYHDDILDTIADQMQNREGGVNYDVIPDAPRDAERENLPSFCKDKFLGFDPNSGQPMWSLDMMTGGMVDQRYHDRMTGF
jgi:hypothetical protein